MQKTVVGTQTFGGGQRMVAHGSGSGESETKNFVTLDKLMSGLYLKILFFKLQKISLYKKKN